MIIAVVTFPTPGQPAEGSESLLNKTAPLYRKIPGLRRKYFVGNDELAGGIYEWTDRDSAEAYFDDAWREKMWTLYAVKPQLQFFDAPCLVDNVVGKTIFA